MVVNFVALIKSVILVQITCSLPVFFRGKHLYSAKLLATSKTNFPEAQWFNQRLNHFDGSSTQTWKQKYYVNSEFYRLGGPVFLMIGGEGPLNGIWMSNGQWITYAKYYQALCVALEHRFYGDSRPTSDLRDENLVYLTSEQALADLANFQSFITVKYNVTQSKWIAFGGSYPGNLAAWYRLKYPHLVTGSVASSAPVHALLDFKQYLDVVTTSLRSMYGQSCVDAFSGLVQRVRQLLTSPDGRSLLKNKLNLCSDIDVTNTNDVSNLFANLAGNVEGVVQYNRDNRAFEGALGTNITIQTVCKFMTNQSESDILNRYGYFNSLFLSTYEQKCLEFKYMDLVNELRNISWSSAASEGDRQWTYQTCAEFGYFQSSDSKQHPFGNHFPYQFFIQQCVDIFGPMYNATLTSQGIKQTNQNYGSVNFTASNILFVNGNVDPWHVLSLLSYSAPNSHALLINGTAHCADMYPDSETDPVQLKHARLLTQQMIGLWLIT